MQWYYAQKNERFGPIDEAELFRLAQNGRLRPEDLVWNPAMGETWAQAASIPHLFAAVPPLAAEEHAGSGCCGASSNRELMRRARASLAHNWGTSVGVVAVVFLLSIACSLVPFVGGIVNFLLTGALTFGLTAFFLSLARRAPTRFEQLFSGFSFYATTLGTYFFMTVFIFLWMLLLIIPGIMAAYSYALTFFVLVDEPTLHPLDALRRSKALMAGRRWKLFCLHCRFFGWSLLCLLTLGLGFLWLFPYVNASTAHFYDDLQG